MKGLSLWQPWASLMARGIKTIETRHWYTNYRGALAIHAAARKSARAEKAALDEIRDWIFAHSSQGESVRYVDVGPSPPRGAVVAFGYLTDCVRITPEFAADLSALEYGCGNFAPGRFAWVFRGLRAVDPAIPMNGAQGLFDVHCDALLGAIGGAAADAEKARQDGEGGVRKGMPPQR